MLHIRWLEFPFVPIHNFDFWLKFQFLAKITFFGKNFDFLTKISIFDQKFYFWLKFRFLTKIPILDQNFNFWPKFPFLTKISIFDMKFHFWPKFPLLSLDFCQGVRVGISTRKWIVTIRKPGFILMFRKSPRVKN